MNRFRYRWQDTMRTLPILAALIFSASSAVAQPVPPTIVSLNDSKKASELFAILEKQSGLKVQAGSLDPDAMVGPFSKKPFWDVLESLAAKTGTRLSVNGASQSITFAKGESKTAASLDGAFRIVSNGVTARADSTTGDSIYTLALDVQWEPRFPVFRIDAQPRVSKSKDNLGNALTVKMTSVKSGVIGYSHESDIRVEGLTRAATTIASIAGEFTVTAAPKMLAFEFADLAKLPVTMEIDGVKATLLKVIKRDEVWELQLTVEYAADPPSFESFESWTNRNAIRLIAPNGRAVTETENQDVSSSGRTVKAAYRYSFKSADLSNRAGWKVVYETPAPLVEFPVRFQLKDIPLP